MSSTTISHDGSEADWKNWKWQQRTSIRSALEFKKHFPDCSPALIRQINNHSQKHRFQITPYYLNLIKRMNGGALDESDPLLSQILPRDDEASEPYAFDGKHENWERPSEMVTPVAQHKYDNRIIIRYSNVCHSYCQFCYEALRTLDKETAKPAFNRAFWLDTLEFLRQNKAIDEVILSGGEPLMHDDDDLKKIFHDVRSVRENMILRIHTRSLTFNPYRITDEFINILSCHRVQAIGLHVAHSNELSPEFIEAVRKLQSVIPITFANVPLLAGVNDDALVMRSLFMDLYRNGIQAGYLYHFMPHSPGAKHFRVSIEKGSAIARSLRRHISKPAVPEYVLPHITGKFTLPLINNAEMPRHELDPHGVRVLRFRNWEGQSVTYPDPPLGEYPVGYP